MDSQQVVIYVLQLLYILYCIVLYCTCIVHVEVQIRIQLIYIHIRSKFPSVISVVTCILPRAFITSYVQYVCSYRIVSYRMNFLCC